MSEQETKDVVEALFGSLAKAFSLSAEETAKALETGTLVLEMGQDQNDNHFVLASYGHGEDRRIARIFKDAIHYEGEEEPDEAPPPQTLS
ncbi:MAG: hypothetical protein ACPGOY_16870 [Rhodospirillaceae bacterium]